jgi:hypothetical protein
MNVFQDEDKFYNLIVWLLSFLLACTTSAIILFIEPSYPFVILLVQIIEIFMFAKIFIYRKRIVNVMQMKNVNSIELRDIEG